MAIRHTVGLDDKIEGEGGVADAKKTPARAISSLSSTAIPEYDVARLIRSEATRILPHEYQVTLDANEQYADLKALAALVNGLAGTDDLKALAARLLYIEQPLPREKTRNTRLRPWANATFIIDEADTHYDAFEQARRLDIAACRRNPAKACTRRFSMRSAQRNARAFPHLLPPRT